MTHTAKIVAQCVPSTTLPIITPTNHSQYDIVGELSDNCSATSFGADLDKVLEGEQPWFGWATVAPPACVNAINPLASTSTPPEFNSELFGPVAFSFFTNSSFASFAFCFANIEEHSAIAVVSIYDDKTIELTDMTDLGWVQDLGLAPNG